MLASPCDGRLKLWVISRALDLRRRNEDLFATGDYLAVSAAGPRARNVVAYARRHQGRGAIAISGRLFASLGLVARAAPVGVDVWGNTRIELPFAVPDSLNDVLSGRTIDARQGELALATIFAELPCALLTW
jgi:(1->4)-alpha-D-glucan 1-alpha-D-glucosylmutase